MLQILCSVSPFKLKVLLLSQFSSFMTVSWFIVEKCLLDVVMESLLTKLLASPLLWIKKSSESLETGASEQLESL